VKSCQVHYSGNDYQQKYHQLIILEIITNRNIINYIKEYQEQNCPPPSPKGSLQNSNMVRVKIPNRVVGLLEKGLKKTYFSRETKIPSLEEKGEGGCNICYKITKFTKFPTSTGGRGSREVGIFPQVILCWSFECFPTVQNVKLEKYCISRQGY